MLCPGEPRYRLSFLLSAETFPVCPNRPRHTFPTLAGINSDMTANETGCGQIKSRLTTHLGRFSRHLLLPFRFQRCFASFVSSSLVLTWYRTLDYSLCDFFSREMLLFDFVWMVFHWYGKIWFNQYWKSFQS